MRDEIANVATEAKGEPRREKRERLLDE